MQLVIAVIMLVFAIWLFRRGWEKSRYLFHQPHNFKRFLPYFGHNLVVGLGFTFGIFAISSVATTFATFGIVEKVEWSAGGLSLGLFVGFVWQVWSSAQWFSSLDQVSDLKASVQRNDGKHNSVNTVTDANEKDNLSIYIPTKRKIGEDGELIEVVDEISSNDFSFSGNGKQSTQTMNLVKGRYRIKYDFPTKGSITVTLASTDDIDAEEEQILWESGKGSSNFVVKVTGNYVLQIDPLFTPESSKWKIEVEPL